MLESWRSESAAFFNQQALAARLLPTCLPLHLPPSVGTIFGIYKAKNPGSGNYSLEDVMRVGSLCQWQGERLILCSFFLPARGRHALPVTAAARDGDGCGWVLHVWQHELHDDHHGQGRGWIHSGPHAG